MRRPRDRDVVEPQRFADQVGAAPDGEEVGDELVDEGDPVGPDAVVEAGEGGVVDAAVGVVGGLVQVRRHGGGEHRLVDPLGPVPADVAGIYDATDPLGSVTGQ